MNKKIIVIILMVFLINITSGCALRRDVPPEKGTRPRPPQEDNLAKTDKEGIEENINGYGIEEDIKITGEEDQNRISCISQQQKMQLLVGLEPRSKNTVLEIFDTQLPDAINYAVKYLEYPMTFDYLLVTAENTTKVRETPSPNANTIADIDSLDKISLLHRVEGDEYQGSSIWYRVAFLKNNEIDDGYIHSTEGTPRNYRFDRMTEAIYELIKQLEEGDLHFISNYKNQNGAPPQQGDIAVDEYGYRVYHSAPAYQQPDINSDFRYIPDGMLVRILDELEDFFHIYSPTFGGEFYVPKQFIDPDATLSQLKHVVVIDRKQQNQGAFEINDNNINLVSYTLCTTGIPGDFSFETTLGSYKAIGKRDRFEYLENGTQNIAGYAPFAIRFSGGAYIHGVPVAYEEENGERVDPGYIEYLHTIGTFPRSNMCVRNFTSHAEFLYNWMLIENGAVIVIE